MKNPATWFEIPVRDLERAARCYETLLGAKVRREVLGGLPYGIFRGKEQGVQGALVQDPRRSPGSGSLVYLDAEGRLDAILARADQAHATIVLPKTLIGRDRFIAILTDTEGNRVGLNSAC